MDLSQIFVNLVEHRGEYHFAFNDDDELLVIQGETAINLGTLDAASERFSDFTQSVVASRSALLESLYGC